MIRAKFQCTVIEETHHAFVSSRKVKFIAVYGNSEENKSFSKATPSGNLEMVIDKETLAYDFFKPGKNYYLNFEEAI